MKKCLVLLALLFFALSAFAANWQVSTGVGVAVPISLYGLEYTDTTTGNVLQNAVDFDASFIGINTDNNFSFKTDVTIGYPFSSDVNDMGKSIASEINETSSGTSIYIDLNGTIDVGFDIGLGYSFVHTSKASLNIFGVLGIEYTLYTCSGTIKNSSLDLSIDVFSLNTGIDVMAMYRFGNMFGIFGNVGFRYIATGFGRGRVEIDSDFQNTNVNIAGKFIYTPTIGVCWTF